MLAFAILLVSQTDLDTTLYRPSFSGTGFLTHPGAKIEDSEIHFGAALELEHAPLIVGSTGDAVVGARGALHVGAYGAFFDGLGVNVSLPVYAMGSDLLDLPPVALGDLWTTATFRVWDREVLTLAIDAQLAIPINTRGALVGKRMFRGGPGASIEAAIGDASLFAAASLMARERVVTGHALSIGNEVLLTLGLSLGDDGEVLQFLAEARARISLDSESRGANPVTLDAALRVRPEAFDGLIVTMGMGSAITEGYGASDVRASLGVIVALDIAEVEPEPPAPRARPLLELLALPRELERASERPVRAHAPLDAEHASCPPIGDALVFDVDSAELNPVARQSLDRIARAAREDPTLLHLLIEGRASSEGDAPTNWGLSARRAEVVFVYLVEHGVSPSRLSIRGVGERAPVVDPEDRRVEVCVLRSAGPLESAAPDEAWRPPWSQEAR